MNQVLVTKEKKEVVVVEFSVLATFGWNFITTKIDALQKINSGMVADRISFAVQLRRPLRRPAFKIIFK